MIVIEPQYSAIDIFLSRAPRGETTDVLVAPHFTESAEQHASSGLRGRKMALVENERALLELSGTLEDKLQFSKHRKLASDFLSSIFSLEYTPEGSFGSFRYGLFDWMGGSELKLPPLFVIRRNRISPESLCRFVRSFKTVPPERRPKVILDAEGAKDADKLLRMSRDHVDVFVPATNGVRKKPISSAKVTIDRFPEAMLSGAFSSCANTALSVPAVDGPDTEVRRYIVHLHQKVQALKGCDRRFDATADIKSLECFLRNRLDRALVEDERAWLAEALMFTLLDRSYILEEGPQPIENALSICQQLNDPVLEAWALRHVNISAGVSPFASAMLKRAAETLEQAGHCTQAAYAGTNQTITDLHRVDRSIDVGRAEAVVEYVLDWAPYCERLSSVINAAGAAFLIAGDLNRAEELFSHASSANGGRLHQISAEINKHIARHIAGNVIPDETVERLLRSIKIANLSKKLDYHHVYLFANLIALTPSRSLKAKLRSHVIRNAYMDYEESTVNDDHLLAFLASKFSFISDGERFRGQRGRFVDQYGLLPLAQFIWN